MNDGFSTLELLIAFSIFSISLTAVIVIAFGSQSYVVDGALAQRALYRAQSNIETTVAQALQGFHNLSEYSGVNKNFTEKVKIADVSKCVKRIESTISWNQGSRSLDNQLISTVVDIGESNAVAHDCATEESNNTWDTAAVVAALHSTDELTITALDEFDHFIYLTASPKSANDNDFLLYEFNESTEEVIERSALNTDPILTTGLNDIDVAGTYAFVASASTTAQLQVIDVSDPDNPYVLWTHKLPGVNSLGSYPEGRTIYYYDNRIYLGTKETSGPEFHIFDVGGNLDTSSPTWLGSIELTHNVNDIMVVDNFAYLATSDNTAPLMVIDISDPTHLVHPDLTAFGFDIPADNKDGTSVFVGTKRVYLGLRQGNPATDTLFILSKDAVTDNTSKTDGLIQSKNLGIKNNTELSSIIIGSDYAFLSTTDPLIGSLIYNISDPTNIFPQPNCVAHNLLASSVGSDLDQTNSFLFLASKSNPGLTIIKNQTSSCF